MSTSVILVAVFSILWGLGVYGLYALVVDEPARPLGRHLISLLVASVTLGWFLGVTVKNSVNEAATDLESREAVRLVDLVVKSQIDASPRPTQRK